MSVQSACGTFSILTSDSVGATKVVSGLPFQPKVIFFTMGGCYSGSNLTEAGSAFWSFGVGLDASNRRCIGSIRKHNVATNVEREHHRDEAVLEKNGDSGSDGALDLTAVASDGFTCTVDTAFGASVTVHWLALGGDSITDVAVGSLQINTTVSDQDITVGFQPDLVMMLVPRLSTTLPQVNGQDSDWHLGVYDGTREWSVASGGDDAVATSLATSSGAAGSSNVRGAYITYSSSPDTLNSSANVSMLANGFRLHIFDSQSTAGWCFYLAMKGGSYRAEWLTTRTDGNDIALSGWGFKPAAALFFGAGAAEDTSLGVHNDAMMSVGLAASPSARAAHASYSQTGVTTSNVKRAVLHDQVYGHIDSSGLVASMDLKSFDDGGLTCVMDDTEASACWVGVLAFGPAETGGVDPFAYDHEGTKPWQSVWRAGRV